MKRGGINRWPSSKADFYDLKATYINTVAKQKRLKYTTKSSLLVGLFIQYRNTSIEVIFLQVRLFSSSPFSVDLHKTMTKYPCFTYGGWLRYPCSPRGVHDWLRFLVDDS